MENSRAFPDAQGDKNRLTLKGNDIRFSSPDDDKTFLPSLSINKVKISLCMIVKNEEDVLSDCLESVKDFVFEMIVVDTGSDDETVKIAEQLGAKVFHFKWQDDFGKARNFSISKASGDWILVLDADEVLDESSKVKIYELINKTEGKMPLSPKIINYDDSGKHFTEHFHCRLFPNNKNYCYRGVIHEQVQLLDGTVPTVGRTPEIVIHHYGYREKKYAEKHKKERNVTLLKKQIKKDKKNPFHYYNLQTVYYVDEDYEKSLSCFNYVKKYAKRHKNVTVLPNSYIMASNSLLGMKKIEEAIELACKAIDISPNFSDAHYLVALGNYRLKKYDKAIEACNRALSCHDDGAALLTDRATSGWKSRRLLGMVYFDNSCLSEALNAYLKVIEEYGDDFHSIVNIARCYDRLNITEKAFEYYQKAVNVGGYQAYIFDMISFVERVSGRDKALNLLDDYLNLLPGDKLISLAKGELYRKNEEWLKAIDLYTYVLDGNDEKTGPYEHIIYLNRGICFYNTGNTDDAEKDFKKVIELDSSGISPYINLSYIYLDRKMYEDAIERLLKVLEIDKENYTAILTLAEARIAIGQKEEAFNLLSVISPSSESEFIKGNLLKADYYILQKDFSQAHSLLMALISRYPSEVNLYKYLVRVLISQGNFTTALNMYDCLIQLSPEDISIILQKARVLTFLKRYKEAEILYKRALNIEPDNEEIRKSLLNITPFST